MRYSVASNADFAKAAPARETARRNGLKAYHGPPCKYGHTERWVADNECLVCRFLARRAQAGAVASWQRHWRERNPARARALDRAAAARYYLRHPDRGARTRATRRAVELATHLALRAEGILL